jgi:Holliday junction resolvase RusA-like endonuclease
VYQGQFDKRPRAIITTDNKKLKPYRQELTHTVMAALHNAGVVAPMAEKHVPVSVVLDFYLERPASIPKKRTFIVVKPDLDKLVRSTLDALTGTVFLDDAQVVELNVRKHYGVPERAEVLATILDPEPAAKPKEGLFD